ncbi:hypothetical protein [Brevundimonas sp.]|uniref:hypothetical protein n=1 Tax=Brevundimonas sp. TaxID=1871086 RepID=UPI0027378370|nr:hypothetical protein [Brevundimonas sp.]MDP3802116.1 hypothetical protein [Brevundimonas sp.]
MKPDRIAGLLAAGLALVACSPEKPSRVPSPDTPGATVDVAGDASTGSDVPAPEESRPGRPGARLERVAPDPQAGVELPEPPVRVPENP